MLERISPLSPWKRYGPTVSIPHRLWRVDCVLRIPTSLRAPPASTHALLPLLQAKHYKVISSGQRVKMVSIHPMQWVVNMEYITDLCLLQSAQNSAGIQTLLDVSGAFAVEGNGLLELESSSNDNLGREGGAEDCSTRCV